ncbi:MAG: hypothetical protein BGN97_14405 [Microbacterium sp. 69-10]|nr:MAG: hypothetical protein BGN97_14405 [Microbacterium sp. 69-10]
MALLTDIEHQTAALRDLFGCDVPAEELTSRMSAFDADALVDAVTAASTLMRAAERISIVGAGVAAARWNCGSRGARSATSSTPTARNGASPSGTSDDRSGSGRMPTASSADASTSRTTEPPGSVRSATRR